MAEERSAVSAAFLGAVPVTVGVFPLSWGLGLLADYYAGTLTDPGGVVAFLLIAVVLFVGFGLVLAGSRLALRS